MKRDPSKRPSKHQTEHILIDTHICQACWECVKACPKGVLGKVNILGIHKHTIVKNSADCIGCYKCVKTCPHGAISKLN